MRFALTYQAANNQAYWPINFERVSQSVQQNLNSGQQALYRLLSALTMTPSPIRIWKHVDSTGRETWSAYDREFDRTASQLSETEMRAWIEARYYA